MRGMAGLSLGSEYLIGGLVRRDRLYAAGDGEAGCEQCRC